MTPQGRDLDSGARKVLTRLPDGFRAELLLHADMALVQVRDDRIRQRTRCSDVSASFGSIGSSATRIVTAPCGSIVLTRDVQEY